MSKNKPYTSSTVTQRQVLPKKKTKTTPDPKPKWDISRPREVLNLKWGDFPRPKACPCDNGTFPCGCLQHSSLPAKKIPKGKLFDGDLRTAVKLHLMGSLPGEGCAGPEPAHSLLPKLAQAVKHQKAAYESLQELSLLMTMPPDICMRRCSNIFKDFERSGDVGARKNEQSPEDIPLKVIDELKSKEEFQDKSPKTNDDLMCIKNSKCVEVKLESVTSDVATETDLESEKPAEQADRTIFGAGDPITVRDLDGNCLQIDILEDDDTTPIHDTSWKSSCTLESLFDLPILQQHISKMKKGVDACVLDLKGKLKKMSLPSISICEYLSSCTDHFQNVNQIKIREYDQCRLCKEMTKSSKSTFPTYDECTKSLKVDSANSCATFNDLLQSKEDNINIQKDIKVTEDNDHLLLSQKENHDIQKEINVLHYDHIILPTKENNKIQKEINVTDSENDYVVIKNNDSIDDDNNNKVISLEAKSTKLSCKSRLSQIFSMLSPYLSDGKALIPNDANNAEEQCIQTCEIETSDTQTAYHSNNKDSFKDALSLSFCSLLDCVKIETLNEESTKKSTNESSLSYKPKTETKQSIFHQETKISTDAKFETSVFYCTNNDNFKNKSYTIVVNIENTKDESSYSKIELSEGIKNNYKQDLPNPTPNINEDVSVKVIFKRFNKNFNIDDMDEISPVELPADSHKVNNNKKTVLENVKMLYRFTLKRVTGVIANATKNTFINWNTTTPDESGSFGLITFPFF